MKFSDFTADVKLYILNSNVISNGKSLHVGAYHAQDHYHLDALGNVIVCKRDQGRIVVFEKELTPMPIVSHSMGLVNFLQIRSNQDNIFIIYSNKVIILEIGSYKILESVMEINKVIIDNIIYPNSPIEWDASAPKIVTINGTPISKEAYKVICDKLTIIHQDDHVFLSVPPSESHYGHTLRIYDLYNPIIKDEILQPIRRQTRLINGPQIGIYKGRAHQYSIFENSYDRIMVPNYPDPTTSISSPQPEDSIFNI